MGHSCCCQIIFRQLVRVEENYILLSNWEIKMYFQILHFTCTVHLVKLLSHTHILYAKSCERCKEERLTHIENL